MTSATEVKWQWLTRLVTSDTFVYVVKRLAQALLTLLLASALSFDHPTGSRELLRYVEAKSENFTGTD
jgi:hypothetical protein